jgi:hypothetical protein
MKTASALAVCVWLFALDCLEAAEDLAAALVEQAGTDFLGSLRVENPKLLLEKLDGISAKFGDRLSDDLPLIAQRFLKNPLLAGVEMRRPWTFLFLNPRHHTNNLAIVVGVSNADVFRDSFGKGGVSNVKADPATSGAAIRRFSETEDAYDHRGYVAALRTGKKVEPFQFRRPVTRQYHVTVRGGEGVIVGDVALVDKLPVGVTPVGSDRLRGDVALAVHLPNVLALYEKEIRQRKAEALEAARDSSARLVRMLGAHFDVVLNLARQVAWVEAAAEFRDGGLKLKLAVPPLADSAFSRAFAGQQPRSGDAALLALMPPDAAMLGALRFTKTPEWTAFLLELMRPVIEASAANNAVGVAPLQSAYRAALETCGDAVAVAVMTPSANAGSADVVEAVRVTDAARARQAHRKTAEAGLPLCGGGLQPGIAGKPKYEAAVAQHAGVEMDRITAEFGAPASGSAGTNLVWHVAFTDHLEFIASGPAATNNLQRLISAAKSLSPTSGKTRNKAATAAWSRKHNGVFCLDLGEYFGLLRDAAFLAADDAHMRRLQTLLTEAGADITGHVLFQPRGPLFEMEVPIDKLVEVFSKKVAEPAAP